MKVSTSHITDNRRKCLFVCCGLSVGCEAQFVRVFPSTVLSVSSVCEAASVHTLHSETCRTVFSKRSLAGGEGVDAELKRATLISPPPLRAGIGLCPREPGTFRPGNAAPHAKTLFPKRCA